MNCRGIKKDLRLTAASLLGDARLMDAFSHYKKSEKALNYKKPTGQDRFSSRIYIAGCPDYGNLGDHAIALAERKFIESSTGCAPKMFYGPVSRYWKILNDEVEEGDVIILQGGGNMGTLYESYENERLSIIDRFKHNKIILFPQTVSYGDTAHERRYIKHISKIYERHPHLYLVAREQMSYKRMKKLFTNASILLTPDIVLSLPPFEFSDSTERDGLCLCLRADKEQRVSSEAANAFSKVGSSIFGKVFSTDTMHFCDYLSPEEGETAVRDKIAELARARLVITDRIHGMIFCALSGTPCIAMDNANGKVGEEYKWLERLPFIRFAGSIEEAVEIMEQDAPKPGKYPIESFSPLFNPLMEALVSALG